MKHPTHKIKSKKPIILCITNIVSISDVAQIINNIGGSAIMSNDKQDALELLNISSALYLNIGTINDNQLDIMLSVSKLANEKNIPIILDPVGVGASTTRTNAFKEISRYKISAIRGNHSEIQFIANFNPSKILGVDSNNIMGKNMDEILPIISKKYNAVILSTGKKDFLCYLNDVHVFNNEGSDKLPTIVGTGCCLSAILATAYSVDSSSNFLISIMNFFLDKSMEADSKLSFKNYFYESLKYE